MRPALASRQISYPMTISQRTTAASPPDDQRATSGASSPTPEVCHLAASARLLDSGLSSPLETLPPEIGQRITGYLDLQSLLNLSKVSHSMRHWANDVFKRRYLTSSSTQETRSGFKLFHDPAFRLPHYLFMPLAEKSQFSDFAARAHLYSYGLISKATLLDNTDNEIDEAKTSEIEDGCQTIGVARKTYASQDASLQMQIESGFLTMEQAEKLTDAQRAALRDADFMGEAEKKNLTMTSLLELTPNQLWVLVLVPQIFRKAGIDEAKALGDPQARAILSIQHHYHDNYLAILVEHGHITIAALLKMTPFHIDLFRSNLGAALVRCFFEGGMTLADLWNITPQIRERLERFIAHIPIDTTKIIRAVIDYGSSSGVLYFDSNPIGSLKANGLLPDRKLTSHEDGIFFWNASLRRLLISKTMSFDDIMSLKLQVCAHNKNFYKLVPHDELFISLFQDDFLDIHDYRQMEQHHRNLLRCAGSKRIINDLNSAGVTRLAAWHLELVERHGLNRACDLIRDKLVSQRITS